MTIDSSTQRTRRALLAAALGAGVATVASALGRPLPAAAASASFDSSSASTPAVAAGNAYAGTAYPAAAIDAASAGPNSVAIRGQGGRYGVEGLTKVGAPSGSYGVIGAAGAGTGVGGSSQSGTGVKGASVSGTGVSGTATHATNEVYGVYGASISPAGRAVFGRSTATTGGTGVFGQADAPDGAGVRGIGWDGATAGKYGTGVLGFSGIHDKAAFPAARANTGVYGHSPAGTGVFGSSKTGTAIDGRTTGASTIAVRGQSPDNGVVGVATKTTGSANGVFGQASSPDGHAVSGYNGATEGAAVAGRFTTASPVGTALVGTTSGGAGVRGEATSGVALSGTATTGHALHTIGRLRFEKVSGVATIGATKSTVVVDPGLDLSSASFVLLTPRSDPGTRRLWYTVDSTANTFTIRVSSAVAADLRVGWLLVG
jgi:hypothetical protein